jgi:signal transduction histidine kinase
MPKSPTYAVRSEVGVPTTAGSVRNKHVRRPAQDGRTKSATHNRAVRLAVLPATVIAVLAVAVVILVLRAQDGPVDASAWGVLAGGAVLGCSVLVGAALAGRAEARGASRQYASARRVVAVGQSELQNMLYRLEQGERVDPAPFTQYAPAPGDALGQLEYEIGVSLWHARAAVAQAAQFTQAAPPDSAEKVEVFVNLARRLQSLVHREINILDELEHEVEDPELLKGLFHVDHLATRIRRHAENVAVLGGSVSRRQWTRPVTLTEVLRSSIAEVEHYSRVKLVPPIEGTLRGHAVADVIHLLAELVENATTFSDPKSPVLLRAQRVTAGLAVEVEDRGLGMSLAEQERVNELLAEPDRIDISKLLVDGRIGLYVVSALARRHGVAVRLQSNIYGGIQAVLVIPSGLIGDETAEAPVQAAAAAHQPAVQPPSAPRPVAPPPAQPLPPAQPPAQQQHARAVDSAALSGRGPSPHDSAAPGGRPPLPQRRAQENLVPQLREDPVAGRKDNGQEAVHDPDLTAAFRRGISLADDHSDE